MTRVPLSDFLEEVKICFKPMVKFKSKLKLVGKIFRRSDTLHKIRGISIKRTTLSAIHSHNPEFASPVLKSGVTESRP